MNIVGLVAILLLATATVSPAVANRVNKRLAARGDGNNNLKWWKTGVIYQIYPRSFLDGCEPACTGNGTVVGITKKLQYLKDLGVTAIWISPLYKSPQKDFGYDISDFKDVGEIYGTMKDFDKMMAAAKKLGLRIIMDLVPNHSSDEHKWFLESKSQKNNPKRDWYVWRPGKKDSAGKTVGPPNNWRTMFCMDEECSGWEYDAATDEYYYHCFLKGQPDFNWRNEELQAAYLDILRFWLRKGVDGFRVDAFAYMLEDPEFRDEPVDPNFKGDPVKDGYSKLIHTRTENIDGLHGLIQKMRDVLNEFGDDKMMIGEIYGDQVVSQEDVMSFYGKSESDPELSMPFNMNLLGFFGGGFVNIDYKRGEEPWRSGKALMKMVSEYYSSIPSFGYPNNVLGNHDVHRVSSRLKSVDLTKVATTILLTLRGTPTIYNGDEIGMTNGYVPEGRRQDPTCKVSYEGMRCRDPERTPLQWNAVDSNAGFTAADTIPWLPVSKDYVNVNVEAQQKDLNSMWHTVKNLLTIRQGSEVLNHGSYTDKYVGDVNNKHGHEELFIYQRISDWNGGKKNGITFIIVNNLGVNAATFEIKQPHYKDCNVIFDSKVGAVSEAAPVSVSKSGSKFESIHFDAEQSKIIRCAVISPHHSPLVVYLAVGMLMAFFGGMGYMYWKNNSRKPTANPNAYKQFSNASDFGGNSDEFDNKIIYRRDSGSSVQMTSFSMNASK